MNLKKLKSARGVKAHALQTLGAKMLQSDVDDAGDVLLFDSIDKDIAKLDAEIRSAEDAERRAKKAVPVPYDPTNLLHRQPRRAMNLKSFKDMTDDRGLTVRADEQAYRAGRFLAATVLGHEPSAEWCQQRGIAVTKAQTEGVSSQGAVLVPDEWTATIINLKEQFGVAAKYCDKVQMTRDSLHLPRRTGGLTAFFVNEGTAPTESSATFDDVQLQAKKAMCLVRVSTELAEDSLISIADYLTQEIAYAFASKEDDCLFSGDGTSTYGGITGLKNAFVTNTAGVSTATGHTTFDALTTTDLAMWRGLLPQFALPNAKFYCSQSFYAAVFRRLGAAGGGNTLTTLMNGAAYSYLGNEVVISQKLPKQTDSVTGTIVAYYGDMTKAVTFGDRRTISIKRSDERYFDTDQIGIQGTERFDIVAHDTGTSSVTGPLVALKMG
jgi:HK97 family phage major capsid protein